MTKKEALVDLEQWDPIRVKCGQCVGCRLEYSRQWAVRCCLESTLHEQNHFVTLTYDEANVPSYGQTRIDPETGEVKGGMLSVNYGHTKKFMKDLRRFWEYHYHHKGIRVFGCGDYGSKLLRPHYHLILFNLPIFDLKPADPKKIKCKSEYPLYESPQIEKIWGKGTVAIGEVNFETCAYTARYMMKKHKGKDAKWYEENHIEPIKSIYSNRPGIGAEYWQKHREHIVEFDAIQVYSGDKIVSVKPPKYYDELFDAENPIMSDIVKHKRQDDLQMAQEILKEQRGLTNRSYDYYLKTQEGIVIDKIKALRRTLE